MMMLEYLSQFLRCPDDGATLDPLAGCLACALCRRRFPLEDGNYVSMVSLQPARLAEDTSYAAGYLAARADDDPTALPSWSIAEESSGRLFEYKRRQVDQVQSLVSEDRPELDLLCDFSAGPGYYTLEYAKRWRYVIHCDLCAGSIAYARRMARDARIGNILFVRMDYLRPAFHQSAPRIICLDTLIRGREHERALAGSIHQSLAPDGAAVIDFHNWWHNPLRRLGLLPENFNHNRSYSLRELAPLLAAAGISRYETIPFHQELDPAGGLYSLLARLLPPTRWMYRVKSCYPAEFSSFTIDTAKPAARTTLSDRKRISSSQGATR